MDNTARRSGGNWIRTSSSAMCPYPPTAEPRRNSAVSGASSNNPIDAWLSYLSTPLAETPENHRPYSQGPRARTTKIGPDGRIARGARNPMSKAFVKEPDNATDLPYEPPAIPAGIKNYMTPRGHRHMQDELHHLLKVEARGAGGSLA